MKLLRRILMCTSLLGAFFYAVTNGWIQRPAWGLVFVAVCVAILVMPLADLVIVAVGLVSAAVVVRSYGVENVGAVVIIVAAFYVMVRPIARSLSGRGRGSG